MFQTATFSTTDDGDTALHYQYEGDWQNGSPHGQGKLRNTDGSQYEGALRAGGPHGFGTLCNPVPPTGAADQMCIQIEFNKSTAVGTGTVVSGLQRYAVDCGKLDEMKSDGCHLVSRQSITSEELKFESLRELEQTVLPHALRAHLVQPIGTKAQKELRRAW